MCLRGRARGARTRDRAVPHRPPRTRKACRRRRTSTNRETRRRRTNTTEGRAFRCKIEKIVAPAVRRRFVSHPTRGSQHPRPPPPPLLWTTSARSPRASPHPIPRPPPRLRRESLRRWTRTRRAPTPGFEACPTRTETASPPMALALDRRDPSCPPLARTADPWRRPGRHVDAGVSFAPRGVHPAIDCGVGGSISGAPGLRAGTVRRARPPPPPPRALPRFSPPPPWPPPPPPPLSLAPRRAPCEAPSPRVSRA